MIPQPSSLNQKKQVHFGSSSSITLPAVEDPTALYWDQASFVERRKSDKVIMDQHSIKHSPAYHEAIVFLVKSFKSENQSREELTERVRIVRAADVRGFESKIVPLLKLQRMVAVHEVLKLQKKLQGIRPEMKATMLRRKSLKMSREARQLAFRLAQADRLDAK